MPIALTSLKIINFRSYPEIELGFTQAMTVLYGPNGAGKTNLLEAVSLLAPGRGLRGAKLEEIARNGSSEWGINAEVNNYRITTGLQADIYKRLIKIDGEKQRGANILAEYASIVWLTPQMDGVFIEGNSERRRFFDRIIYNFDPEHASRVAVYENALRERMKLLKTGSTDKTWLKVLERRMAEYGTAIAAARNEVIGYLQESLAVSATSFPRPQIEICGDFENLLHEKSALEIEDIFTHQLFETRYDDFSNGRTSVGVHKTDFRVINSHKNLPAVLSSTGEQKALLLSIIIGLARLLKTRKNKAPIVLLDEVIAHLDEARRRELFGEILSLGCQCLMTGTETSLFGAIPAQFIEVKNNAVSSLNY